jgi:ribonuclease BN (tRNA processing enzyme)
MSVRLRLLGTGDAFGTGGRLQTCFLVEHSGGRLLVDCGASSLVAMRREGVRPEEIDLVLLSHLHGDHFGGLPFLLLDSQYASGRERPLTVVGPPGTPARVEALMEASFPGSWGTRWRFELSLLELAPGERREVGGIAVRAFEVRHPSGAPSLALRLEVDGRVLAYSGDTEWVPALAEAARGADLLVTECYRFEPGVPYHLDHRTLEAHRGELDARRVVLTHLGSEAYERRAEMYFEVAQDGMTLEL